MSAIEFIDVKKQFKDGDTTIEALKTTNFKVEEGEFVAIIGPSGSGKSTFLTLAGGLQSPTEGQVKIDGENFSEEKERTRAKLRFKKIGFILQASNLIPFLSVENQLILVDKISSKEQHLSKDKLFDQLGVSKLVKKYPEELSGGERQRVAIARALYNDPTIILADEPTASLDSERAFEVVEILAKESKEKNKAIIMVTHDIRLVQYCDRIIEIRDGLMVEKDAEKIKQKYAREEDNEN